MESIGAKLRDAREGKDLSIEQAARDTHIAKRFLIALENEDYDEFPGEVYLIGFLRTYGDYLELNGDDLVSMYRNLQIQEQPPPMEELLERHPSPRSRKPVLLAVIAVVVVAAIVVLFVTGIIPVPDLPERQRADDVSAQPAEPAQAEGTTAVLEQEFLERRFSVRDSIVLNGRESDTRLSIVEIAKDQVVLQAAGGMSQIAVGENRPLDIDGDNNMDIRVLVRETSLDADRQTAVLRIDRVVQSPNVTQRELTEEENSELALGQTNEPSRQRGSLVIQQAAEPEPFTIDVEFRGQCLFRYEIDDNPRQETYFRPGDRVRDSVRTEVRMWFSNAGATQLRVAGEPIGLGTDGEVAVVLVRWRETDAGRHELVMLPLY